MSHFESSSNCYIYQSATFWKTFTINVALGNLQEFPLNTVGDYLKYHRLLNNVTQEILHKNIGVSHSYIKMIEANSKLPSRIVSHKLARFFRLDTKYFYDVFLEDTHDVQALMTKYRENNNLSIKTAANLLGVNAKTWKNWESGNSEILRTKYYKLKELGVIP